MRASLLGVAALVSVSFSGCYSNGGWHAPNWDKLAWWKAPKTEAPASPSMMAGGPHVTRPSEAAMAGGDRQPGTALPLTPSSPGYGGAQASYTNTYPNTGAPAVQQPYASAGPAARTADASAGYNTGSRYDASARDMSQRGAYDPTYSNPNARIHSAQPASPSYRDVGTPESNPYVASERNAPSAAETDPGRYGSSDRGADRGTDRAGSDRYEADNTGSRYESAPAPRDNGSNSRYDSRDAGIGKTGYEPGNTGYEPPQHTPIDRAEYATKSNLGSTSAKRDAQYQPGGTGRYSGSTAVADRSASPSTERGSTYSERYRDTYGQPVDSGYDQPRDSGYNDDYRRDSGASRY